jgi:hypothetical protein
MKEIIPFLPLLPLTIIPVVIDLALTGPPRKRIPRAIFFSGLGNSLFSIGWVAAGIFLNFSTGEALFALNLVLADAAFFAGLKFHFSEIAIFFFLSFFVYLVFSAPIVLVVEIFKLVIGHQRKEPELTS